MSPSLNALVVVVLCGFAAQAAVLHPKDRYSGFTLLGSRSSFDGNKKEFIESNYYASAASGIWTQAQDDCVKTFGSDGHLVSIEEHGEQEALNVWLQERGSGGAVFWTSGIYQINEQIWRWAGNTEYNVTDYQNWEGGDPPTSPNGRQRIGLNHQNQFSAFWISVDDTNLERYICEMKSADNVGTGTPGPTTTTQRTTPSSTTTSATTKPTAAPCNKEVKGFSYLGSLSKYSDKKKEFVDTNYYASAASGIWTQAQDDCFKTFGSDGHLVSIEEDSEQKALNVWLQERGSGGAVFWTSGIYQINDQIWRWAGNTEYNITDYQNWEGGNPPTSPNGRQRIGLNHQNQFSAFWISVDDTNLERYICEMKSAENVGC